MTYIFSSFTFLILIYFLKKTSNYLNLIDKPSERKKHKGNIPLIGGIAIYINFFLYFYYYELSYHLNVIVYTSSILLILGAIDDSIGLGVTFRLFAQLLSCLIIIGSGLTITNIGNYMYFPNIEIGLLSVAFTVLCVMGLTNAFNFMDGIDGLCSGLVLVSISSIILFSFIGGTIDFFYGYEFIIIICVSLVLFLCFNLTSYSKIFLGDSGSMTLGFLVSWFLVLFSQSEKTVIHPVLTIWCVTIPVFDLIAVFIRRISRRINPFIPDRRHVHHLLLELGYSDSITLAIILLFSIFLNFIGFFIFIAFGPMPALISFVICLFIYISLMIFISRYIHR
jgi:UDP-GlcNAc:undecaprenyl-phosphate GlcNAc-1-phosphate transferase|tara:strand:+ start:1024 stop:2034 length:1011 start_codon:yes stop_codon:yes gene_type:complete